jgi:DNA-binding NarL/FixJ family response regulator
MLSESSEPAIQPAPMPPSGPAADSCGMASYNASSPRVFLADDSPAIRERVSGLLAAARIDVVGEAATPCACIAGILASAPDVVVLDVQLEGGSGLEVLKAVRSADPRIVFVVFSNNSGAAYRKRYLAEGAARFLDKCADFDELAPVVAIVAGHSIH